MTLKYTYKNYELETLPFSLILMNIVKRKYRNGKFKEANVK